MTHEWPKQWSEIRTVEQKDETTIGYDEPYVALGNDDESMRIYDGTVYIRTNAGEEDRDAGDSWYPLRRYIEVVAAGAEP